MNKISKMKQQKKSSGVSPANLQVAAATAEPAHKPSRNEKLLRFVSRTAVRILGILAIGILSTTYFQVLPLLFILAGGFLGVQPSASVSDTDTLIWLMTCAGILIPMVYIFLKGVKYTWVRFVVDPFPLFPFVRNTTKRA